MKFKFNNDTESNLRPITFIDVMKIKNLVDPLLMNFQIIMEDRLRKDSGDN